MASPQLADPPVAINPHQSARYTLKLSDRITNPSQSQSRFKTVKFNHKPKATGNVRTTTIQPASTGDQFTLCMRDKETADSTTANTYEYAGQRRELKTTYVLLFDKENQTATLEPLEETYAFNLKRAPWEKDPAKLAQQYPQVMARSEKPGRLDAVTDDVDDLFSDGSDSQSLNGSVFGGRSSDDEEPEEGNPYDFRRFVQDADQSEGFVSPVSHSGTPLRTTSNTTTSAPARSTPLPQTVTERPKPKQALKPASKQTVKQQAPSRKRKSPEPDKPAAKPKPSTTSSTNTSAATTKTQPTPAIRLDRRASTRPTDSNLSTSAPAAVPSSNQSPKSSSRTSREQTPEEDEEDDDDPLGGLEIDWGGSDKSASRGRPRRSIALAFEQGVTGDGPVSLRSAADSASPNSRLHTPNLHPTSAKNRDVIEFDFGGGGDSDEDDDDDVFHEQHPREPRDDELEEDDDEDAADVQQQEQQEDDDGYAEDDEDADGDVDPLTLGSPAADTLQHQQQHHQQQVELGDEADAFGATYDDDDDGGDDLEDDFEAEMAQALASAAEEDVVAPEDSEEESEEE